MPKGHLLHARPSVHLCTYATPKNTTLSRQKDLLNLTVPNLEDTLTKFLKSVTPFLNEDEFARTEALVKEFGNQGGNDLHNQLRDKASREENWVIEK